MTDAPVDALVTQEDREAAANFVKHRGILAARIRIGGASDSLPIVQAFAQHRRKYQAATDQPPLDEPKPRGFQDA